MKRILFFTLLITSLVGCGLSADNDVLIRTSSMDKISQEIKNLEKEQQKMIEERERQLSELHRTDIRIDNLTREIFYDQGAMNITSQDINALKKRE